MSSTNFTWRILEYFVPFTDITEVTDVVLVSSFIADFKLVKLISDEMGHALF